MGDRVPFPLFELYGHPCPAEGCNGVLVESVSIRTHEAFAKCASCGHETQRIPAAEKLAWAVRTIERAIKGEKTS